ncbi:MAG: hypothetical protein M3170_06845, partial [Candidatus Dormibacteraeota bacterium]|nr:hypothetical protein [Candidatus Dormibacteraeota bacterium]
EEDWVTMVTSMVYYAVNTKKLRIDILSPMNEQDTGYPEGPSVASGQYVRLMDKLSTRLDGLGLSSVRLLGPDTARLDSGVTDYMPRMQADAGLMAKVDHFGLHDYSGNAAGADQQIKASTYPAKNFWMTEFSSSCSGCDTGTAPSDEWSFAAGTAGDLLSFLQEGAASTLAYEGYDSYYEHHGSRSYWGLLAYDAAAGTYAPRSRFWALAQVYRFAAPGSIRIGASSAIPGVNAVALLDPATGRTTVVGRNATGSRQTVNGTLQSCRPWTAPFSTSRPPQRRTWSGAPTSPYRAGSSRSASRRTASSR